MEFDDLFDAFDGSEKVEEVDIQAQPQLKRKSDAGGDGGVPSSQAEGGGDEENGAVGAEGGSAAKRAKMTRVPTAEEVGDADPYKVQPTITQNQEIVTADGRKVISFSAYPANYVAPPVRVEPLG